MNITSHFLRHVAMLMMLACALLASAQSDAIVSVEAGDTMGDNTESVSNDTVSSGFNALDYVLQRPNRNQFYKPKKFGDHLFIALEAGAGWFHNPERLFDFEGTDAKFGINVGDWVTPVHGWRVGINGGSHRLDGGHKPFYVGMSADYIANLSALVRGDNPSRKFEVIGTAGIEYQLNHHCSNNYNIFGFRLGLQGRWNFSKSMFAYIEPRIGGYFGPGITHGTQTQSDFHYRVEPSIMVGLGMRCLSRREIIENSDPFESKSFEHNMFYEVSVGWINLKKHNGRSAIFDDHNMEFAYSAGKWFTPESGLRLTATYGKLSHPHQFVMAGLDYVWNLTSTFSGYRTHDHFELDLTAGVAGIYVNNARAKLYPALEAGLKAIYKINHNWGIFIEPQLRLFGRHFTADIADSRPMSSVNIGLRYTVGDFKYDYAENFAKFSAPEQKRNFITATVGPAKYKKGPYGIGYALEVGYGRWFSPMSAWRVAVDAQTFPHADLGMRFRNISLGGDYILSISSALCGYNPQRFFDFSGSVGAYAGVGYCPGESASDPTTRFTASFKASFLARFRLSESLSAVVQTQSIAAALPLPTQNYRMRPEMRLMLGAHYSF